MKSFFSIVAVGVLLLPGSAFAFTLDASDEVIPVESITIITEDDSSGVEGDIVLIGEFEDAPNLTLSSPEIFTINADVPSQSGETITFSNETFQKIAKLETRIEKLEARADKVSAKIEKLEAKIAKLVDKSAEKFANKIAKLEEKLTKKQARLEKITNKIAVLQEKLGVLGGGVPVAGAATVPGILVIQ